MKEEEEMKKVYFTITGIWFYYGTEIFRKKDKVRLIKEPDNKHDSEAIRVEKKGLGKVGYVANSPHTVLGESFSAGRLYDRIGKKAKGTVIAVTERGIVCKLNEEKEKKQEEKGAEDENQRL